MEGLELFGDAPVKEIKRYDLSKYDPMVLELYTCIQQMIGKHLNTLKKELLEHDELKQFSNVLSTVYRLLCIHEYKTLEEEASKSAYSLWELIVKGFSHIVCCKEAFLITQISSCFSALVIQLDDPLKVVPDQLVKNIQKVDLAFIMGAPVIITTALHQQFGLYSSIFI